MLTYNSCFKGVRSGISRGETAYVVPTHGTACLALHVSSLRRSEAEPQRVFAIGRHDGGRRASGDGPVYWNAVEHGRASWFIRSSIFQVDTETSKQTCI